MGSAKKPMTVNQIVEKVRADLKVGEGKRQLDRVLRYLEGIIAREEELDLAVKAANERPGTAFFATTGNALSPRPIVAVRIHGRQVGTIEFMGPKERVFRPTRALASDLKGWNGDEWGHSSVRRFLARVRVDASINEVKEALVQSAIFRDLAEAASAKKQESLLRHQPVLLNGLPYQFPLPITASGEEPRVAKGIKLGYADVLARQGNGSRLRVFELKRPKASDARFALAQAVAYAAALEVMLQARPAVMFKALNYSTARSVLGVLTYEMDGTNVRFGPARVLASPNK
jgi:hypothetical protein